MPKASPKGMGITKMKTETKEKIKNFFKELNFSIYIDDYVDIDEIDTNKPFDSIREMIQENGGFDVEIIHNDDAMDYLKENDPTLLESLEIASEYCFSPSDLNSGILASLLASKKVEEEFYELEDEITEFFNSIKDELSDDDDEDEDENDDA